MALTKVTQHSLGNSAVTTAKLGTAPFGFANSSANVVYMAANGNVGIGTSTPGYRLQIKGESVGITSGDGTVTNLMDYATIGTITASNFAITSNNVTRLNITANGAVQIKSSVGATPTYSFTNNGEGLLFRYNDDAGVRSADIVAIGNNPAGAVMNMRFFTNLASTDAASERMRIAANGNIGMGTTSPGNVLHVYKAGDGQTPVQFQTGNGNGLLYFYNDSNGWSLDTPGTFRIVTGRSSSGSPERMNIDTSGNILISNARASARGLLDLPTTGGSGGVSLAISRGGDAGEMVKFFSTNSSTTVIGNIYNTGNTNTLYNTSSDYRLKRDIARMTGALAKVALLKPCTYVWKSTGAAGQGFIAHELQEVVPDAVTGEKDAVDEDGNIQSQGIDTSYLVATLTAAIQELKAEFDAYKASHP